MHPNRIKIILLRIELSITILFLCNTLSAQTRNTVEKLNDYVLNIIDFNREYPQEKVYLHMDNRSYFIGDTIWFKAYVMDATTLRPTETSGVLYVELLNEKGVEMEHKKLRIVDGMCHGEFSLKEDYRTGYYEIRAYTRNMLNFGNDSVKQKILGASLLLEGAVKVGSGIVSENIIQETNDHAYSYYNRALKEMDKFATDLVPHPNHTLFSRVFPVYMHPEKPGVYKEEMDFYPMHTKLSFPKETEIDIRPDNLQLSFFPEGGALVEGIPSIVAFEVVDQWGRKRDIKGYITEEKDNRIIDFKTFARGRGTFSLCPEVGKRYYAHVSYKDKDYRFELPQAENTGYVLRLSPPIANGAAMFSVLAAPNAPRELLGWTLQCRGALTAFDTLTVDTDGNSAVGIPSERLQPGVNQLTLYNARGEILADRLFFVSPMVKPATLTLQHLPECVEPFQEITLDMSVSDNSYRHTSHSYFSLSVTDADERTATYDTRDIRSELLLASDLKGFIEDVDSYFQHKSSRAMAADIDLLMLVQGWRRYEWCTMVDTAFTPRYTPEKGLQIDGYVVLDQVMRLKSERASISSSTSDNPIHLHWANNYVRLPDHTLQISLSSPFVQYQITTFTDSLGNFSVDIGRTFPDEADLKIKVLRSGKGKKHRGLFIFKDKSKAYPILSRTFSPATTPYSYYQQNVPSDDITFNKDLPSWDFQEELNEVTVKKRFKQKSEIYYDHPEIIIDYYKECNHIIDRGLPLINHYNAIIENFFRIDYSLRRHNLLYAYTLQDPVIRHITRGGGKQGKAYIMPRSMRIYSNLLSREDLLPLDFSTKSRQAAHCVIDYYTKEESPRYPPYEIINDIRYTYYEGYSRVVKFYSPDYSECALPDTTDYRRTLLWVPNIETGFDGKAKVTFYNNARTKHIHVRAEGFTRNGEFIVYDSNK